MEKEKQKQNGVGRTLGQNITTAFWEPKETKPQAPHDMLLTILLQPAPMNTLFTSTSPLKLLLILMR